MIKSYLCQCFFIWCVYIFFAATTFHMPFFSKEIIQCSCKIFVLIIYKSFKRVWYFVRNHIAILLNNAGAVNRLPLTISSYQTRLLSESEGADASWLPPSPLKNASCSVYGKSRMAVVSKSYSSSADESNGASSLAKGIIV